MKEPCKKLWIKMREALLSGRKHLYRTKDTIWLVCPVNGHPGGHYSNETALNQERWPSCFPHFFFFGKPIRLTGKVSIFAGKLTLGLI